MSDKAKSFPIYFQRSLLSRVLQDEDFGKAAKEIIEPSHFDSEPFKWICKQIKNNLCSIPVLINELKILKGRMDDNLGIAIKEELKSFLKTKQPESAQYGLDKLKEFIEFQDISNALLSSAKLLKADGSIESIRDIIRSASYSKFDTDQVETVEFISGNNERFLKRKSKLDQGEIIYFPLGIRAIDEGIKGPMPGQLWSIFGDTNIGKSALAVNIGKANVVSGFRVWHIVIEDLLDMTTQRYDTAFSSIEYSKFTYCNHTPEDLLRLSKIFELLQKKRSKYLYVTKIEEGCTINQIEREYEKLRNINKFNPDLILIDSPYNMQASATQESHRLNCARVYSEGRMFCRKNKKAIILFDQTKQELKGKRADTDASSESYDKARFTDGFITMNQSRLQRKEGIIELWIAKMKDREKHFAVHIKPQMKIMRFESINFQSED